MILKPLSRRTVYLLFAGCLALTACTRSTAALSISTFAADVTVPMGHGMMGGSWLSKTVADPLEAHGIVLYGEGKPVVFVAVDWCEIRNEAYFQWQQHLAEALGTLPERVMISTIHQHDAPVADLVAEQILRERKLQGTVCDPEFHRRAVEKVAAAALDSRSRAVPLTHLGLGQAKVEKVASLRRYVTDDGAIHHDRMSRSTSAIHKAADEGAIDPWLKTLSFWNGEKPIAALSFYAVHPMSYYGKAMSPRTSRASLAASGSRRPPAWSRSTSPAAVAMSPRASTTTAHRKCGKSSRAVCATR